MAASDTDHWRQLVRVAILVSAVVAVGWVWRALPAGGVFVPMGFVAPGDDSIQVTRVMGRQVQSQPNVPPEPAAAPAVAVAPPQVESPPQAAPPAAASGRLELSPGSPRPRNWLAVSAVELGVAISEYTDCTGATPLTRSSGAHFECAGAGLTDLIGHNPGVFTPLTRAHVNDTVQYWDASGSEADFVIRSVDRMSATESSGQAQDNSYPHMVLVTCAVPDGSEVWLLKATPL